MSAASANQSPRWGSLAHARPVLTLAAGVLLYLGERPLAATAARLPLSIAGAVLLVAGAAWPAWVAWRQRGAPMGAAWRLALPAQAVLLLSAAAYGLHLVALAQPGGAWLGVDNAAGWLGFAWALLLAGGAVAWALLELAMAVPGTPDPGRVRRAATTGWNLGLLLAIVITLNFGFNRLAWSWDLAYFKTTQPSQATRDIAATLGTPVRAALFFAQGNPVGAQVQDYFAQLQRQASGSKLAVETYDADLKPLETQAYQARGNGAIVFKRGDLTKSVQIGTTQDQARTALRRLDRDVHAALLEVSREKRVAYGTIGHGERFESRPDADPQSRFFSFESLLSARNFSLQTLGFAQGLGTDIPKDAALVIVAGPTEAFSRAEGESLRRYVARGGKVLVFLEPSQQPDKPARGPGALQALLKDYGVDFDPTPQANDRIFGRRNFTDADHGLLVTNAYGAHPAVSPLRRAAQQYPLAFLGAGALRKGEAPAGAQVQETVTEMAGTWGDKNRNFRFDPPAEKQETLALAMAVSLPPGATGKAAASKELPDKAKASAPPAAAPALLVFADADVASDLLLQNRTNQLAIASGLEWLAGEPEPAGLPSQEEDQPIQHVKGDEWLWFYLPVLGVPALVLLAGIVLLRRQGRRMGRAQSGAAGPAGSAP